jgi:hypothetical protein
MAGTDRDADTWVASIDPRVVEAAAGARAVGSPTTDGDDFWSWPRRPAMALAREIGARLILADISTRSAWMTPYGTGGFGADRLPPYSDGTTAVSKDELGLLGHETLRGQVVEAEAEGIDAVAWLADRPGGRGARPLPRAVPGRRPGDPAARRSDARRATTRR